MVKESPIYGKQKPVAVLEINDTGYHAVLIKIESRSSVQVSNDSSGTDSLGGHLTPAETAVARAAVTGQSNREIAKQRGSAPRTVAVQLGSIYQKLGVSSRTELAAVIAREARTRCST